MEHEKLIKEIKAAIFEVTGLKFEEYTTKSRKWEYVYARMIFAYNCYQNGVWRSQIAKYINRSPLIVDYAINKYADEIIYNREFSRLAEKVEEMLAFALKINTVNK
jgi:hypothetical protein